MGLFSRKPPTTTPTPTPAVALTGEELRHAARELNSGNPAPADALVDRGGTDTGLRRQIAMHVLGAAFDDADKPEEH